MPQILGLRLEPYPFAYLASEEIDEYPDPDKALADWLAHVEGLGAAVAVTAERLRSLPLGKLKEAALAHMEGGDFFEPFRTIERGPGGRWPDEHYRQVADVYRRAVEVGQHPLNAVKERWVVSKAMAAKYVKRARVLGYLGYPTRPGVAGATEETSPIAGVRMPASGRRDKVIGREGRQ